MPAKNPLPVIYFNGEWIEANPTLQRALRPGILRGNGVFETVAVENGRLCFWADHYERLLRGVRAFGLNARPGRRALEDLIAELIERNGLLRARLRVARYRDDKINHLVIVGVPVSAVPASGRPLTVQISPLRRHKGRTSHLKSLNYQPFYDAHCMAREQGFDEALLLDPRGHLVEGSTTNIFFVTGGVLHTPAVALGCLNGIVRGKVIGLAPQIGCRVRRGTYRWADLKKADEVFMTNSLIGVRAVGSLNGQALPENGDVTRRLREAYRALIRAETGG